VWVGGRNRFNSKRIENFSILIIPSPPHHQTENRWRVVAGDEGSKVEEEAIACFHANVAPKGLTIPLMKCEFCLRSFSNKSVT